MKKRSPPHLEGKEQAAKAFMKAWAEWHDNPDPSPSHEIIEAAGGIFEAYGMTFDEDKNGKNRVKPITPKTPTRGRKAA